MGGPLQAVHSFLAQYSEVENDLHSAATVGTKCLCTMRGWVTVQD